MGVTKLLFEFLDLMVFLAGHIGAMVVYHATKLDSNMFTNDWAVCS